MLLFTSGLLDNPPALVAYLAAFGVAYVTGIVFHEFCHAWSAYELGDDTAARQGRLTLNPAAHVDPLGLLVLFLVGLGWGRPTPVNTARLRYGPRHGGALVSFAGPASNFVVAAVAALPLRLGLIDGIASFDDIANASGDEIVGLFLIFLVWINIILGFFNLIPLGPLDGASVVGGILPREAAGPWFSFQRRYGMPVLATLWLIGLLPVGISPLGWLIGPFADEMLQFLVQT